MIINTKSGKQFRVSDPHKIEEFKNVFRSSEFPETYQFMGNKNLLTKGEVASLIPEESEVVKLPEEKKGLFYNVRLSYSDNNDNVTITAKDLPLVMWGFAKETKVVLGTSAFRGKDIISILPDKVASMGWNKGFKPEAIDQADINRTLGRSLENYQEEIKILLQEAVSQKDLIQKSLPLLDKLEQKLLN